MRRRAVSWILIAAFAAVLTNASAETTPEEAVKYRQGFMRSLSGHGGAVSAVSRGLAGDPKFLGGHIQSIVNLAEEMSTLFPAGSTTADSGALPSVWERPDEFAQAIASFRTAVDGLAAAGETGDLAAVDAAFRDVGRSCRGCHENFRQQD